MELTEISAEATDAKSFQHKFSAHKREQIQSKSVHSSFIFNMDNERNQKSKDATTDQHGLHDVADTAVVGKIGFCSTST